MTTPNAHKLLTIELINTISLSANIDLVNQYISDLSRDIYALTNTWLNIRDTCTPAVIQGQSCKLTSLTRTHTRRSDGGGVALLTKKEILITSHKQLPSTDSDILLTILLINKIPLHIILFYRPPDNPRRKFFINFTDIIHNYHDKNFLILGDFNFNFYTTRKHHHDFQILCSELNLKQHVTDPTHRLGHTLDLYITKSNSNLIHSPPQ